MTILIKGMSMADLINAGIYDKDINEPTPLEQKEKLVAEVKKEFFDDLLFRGVNLKTMTLAWDLSEEVNGADEALNPIFLHMVLNYIDVLEDFYTERQQTLVSEKERSNEV